ncbi:YheC/YheD family protein [Paenibacillus sp. LMG 31460]|uniref:YheC/YheD family protein n=1 Tax=Paenibacillus germinis TaxID=2654979 RepID=A0ABX1YWG3_9BACL|nr:YheC/YheD family protein [Paenibacillus germinis]NOU85457.1 YheC/YheD family protein [Paenibacillus germinis]
MDEMHPSLARLAKWNLHRFYSKHSWIAKHLPPTTFYTRETLSSFLQKYKTIYIKANTQHTGKGIIKAWKTTKGYQFVKVRGKTTFASSIEDIHQHIKNTSPQTTFIVQKAIDLAEINSRPFDIRVMMMRDGQCKWNYAGMVVKVAGQGSVVSNVQRGGGYVISIEEALKQSLLFNKERIESIKKQLISLSYKIMHYSQKFPFYSFQCGIDLAVDKKGRIWIIEVNLHNPSHGLFNKQKNKSSFKRIGHLYTDYRKHNKRLI